MEDHGGGARWGSRQNSSTKVPAGHFREFLRSSATRQQQNCRPDPLRCRRVLSGRTIHGPDLDTPPMDQTHRSSATLFPTSKHKAIKTKNTRQTS
eukprot:scaffold2639_cov361-Pavlova_lutheri.AAC.13